MSETAAGSTASYVGRKTLAAVHIGKCQELCAVAWKDNECVPSLTYRQQNLNTKACIAGLYTIGDLQSIELLQIIHQHEARCCYKIGDLVRRRLSCSVLRRNKHTVLAG